MNIKRFFSIGFSDRNISNKELRAFTEDHIGKLTSLNTSGPLAGQFTAMLAATQPPYDTFIASISTQDSNEATRQGETLTKDAALAAFSALASRRESRVKDKFGKPSAAYEEFFPHGLTEYTRPALAQAVVLMDRMVDKATKYVADTGADLVTEFTNARTAFINARSEQVEQKGEVSEAASARRIARAALERQLQKNVLTIALLFVGQPERATDFFDPSKLKNPIHAPATNPPP